MRRTILLLLLVGACSPERTQTRPITERERDSVLGASQLPGAQGVRGALRAADSAAARSGSQ